MKNIPLPVFLIAAIAAILWLPFLLAKGMFMDGIYDSILAQNLAHGVSTFWAPQVNDYANPAYWNNPPLSMWTLGWCYKIFGDQIVVERIYSLGCGIIQIILLAIACKILWKSDDAMNRYNWLPGLLLLLSPLTGWCYSTNLMENTMSLFTTGALIFFLLFLQTARHLVFFAFVAALLVFLAIITKGPTGLFPLAFPVLFIYAYPDRWKQLLVFGLVQFIMLFLLFTFIFSFPAANHFLHEYLAVQLLPNINHSARAETSPYTILRELPIMLSPYLLLWLVYLFGINRLGMIIKSHKKIAISFILAGLSASVPVMISLKQRKFYLLPSLPLFVLGFSILLAPLIKWIELRLEIFKAKGITSLKAACLLVVIVCLALTFYNRNTFSRDEVLLTDIENILPLLRNDTTVCADWSLYGEWSLRAYCTRYYNKKVYMPDKISETRFYMTKPGMRGDRLSPSAIKIYSGKSFDLYRLI